MNLLIIYEFFHNKNKIGLDMILNYLNISYKYGDIADILNYDIIYLPDNAINTSLYPNKKFIFGPHFSVFPDNKLTIINNSYKNSIYIQPSDWVRELWNNNGANHILPIKTFPFPVEIDKFKPLESVEKNNVFIMFKQRNINELNVIINFLHNKNIHYKIFDYNKRYNENDYIKYLQLCKYGIWLGCHESQGFALEEALSINIPLLVWEVKSMSQEENSCKNYINVFGSVIPYFDKRCGEYFYEKEELEVTFNKFMNNLGNYKPREYIVENLSVKKSAEKFITLVNSF